MSGSLSSLHSVQCLALETKPARCSGGDYTLASPIAYRRTLASADARPTSSGDVTYELRRLGSLSGAFGRRNTGMRHSLTFNRQLLVTRVG